MENAKLIAIAPINATGLTKNKEYTIINTYSQGCYSIKDDNGKIVFIQKEGSPITNYIAWEILKVITSKIF